MSVLRAGLRRTPAASALLVALLAGCGGGSTPPTVEPLRPVRVLRVQPAGAVEARQYAGQARAANQVRLSFRVPGTVIERPVAIGSAVPAGALLARLDARDYAVRAQEAQASVASARAQERNAAANYDRVRGLYENGNAASGELDAARSGADSARAALNLATGQLEGARLQLSYTTLRASGNCRVLDAPVEALEYVVPGQTVLELACGQAMEVALAIPEAVISRIRSGSTARVRLDALPGREYLGTVTRVGAGAARSATTFPVVVALDEPGTDVLPGMSAQATLDLPSADTSRIVLPAAAVAEDRAGRHVYVLDTGTSPATVRRRAVEIGELVGEGIELRAGVMPGEQVVIAGVSRLQEGMAVLGP